MTRATLKPLSDATDTLTTLARAGLLGPLRPDRYWRMIRAAMREGPTNTVGFTVAAARCPDRLALVDERGSLTWRELDRQIDALASALQARLPVGEAPVVAIMARNHRGFVQALAAANRISADVLLLNTSFAGPALAEVISRETSDRSLAVVYDEEFTELVDRALSSRSDAQRIVAWTDGEDPAATTVDGLIAGCRDQRPTPTDHSGRLILLTSGTTGPPKGAARTGGGVGDIVSILKRTPWRAEETTVIAAPMFHAWGYGQLVLSALMACTIVTRRKFDPEATLELVDRYRATGLSVVPVMFDRIMELPEATLARYSGRSLRFAAASGSRMRPDVVTAFMDRFGDVIYNNYNATEAGMIATATPEDLRAAPNTAGTPVVGTEIRILDADLRSLPAGETGTIYVRNANQFDGYTKGSTDKGKQFDQGYMSSGDVGYLDQSGRLFVVGRDDEMIVSGGENIYPIEVEKALATHPAVAEAVVVGVDDQQYGQRLVAFVVANATAPVVADELKSHVRESLANYKVPRSIHLLDQLPRNSTGKVLRRELLRLAEADGTDD